MMREANLKCLKVLYETGHIVESKIPGNSAMKGIIADCCTLGWLEKQWAGRGNRYVLKDAKEVRPKLKKFIERRCPGAFAPVAIADNPTAQNVLNHSNSKAKKSPTNGLAFLAGKGKVEVNGNVLNLQALTAQLGTFCIGMPIQQLKADKLCFVENFNGAFDCVKVFLAKAYEEGYVFVHLYGRIGEPFLKRVSGNQILIAPDYDYIGLKEYLRCKAIFPQTKLFVPANYDAIYAGHKTKLKAKQTYPERVRHSKDPWVVHIRTQLNQNGAFLEQQGIIGHILAERKGSCTCKDKNTIAK